MVCGEAEKICSSLGHHVQSFSVNAKSAGSGSICGRGGGWYWPCGWAAQAVIASAHATLSSFESCSMVLLLIECGSVLGAQLSAQVVLRLARDLRLEVAVFLPIRDGRVITSLPLLDPVATNAIPGADRQENGGQEAAQKSFERAHAIALPATSY